MTILGGTMTDAAGQPLTGQVVLTPTAIVRDDATLVLPTPVKLDVTGGVVPPVAVRETGPTWRYTVTVLAKVDGQVKQQAEWPGVEITGTSIAISQLVPALPPIAPSNADVLAARIGTVEQVAGSPAVLDSSVASLVGGIGETGTALDGRYGRRDRIDLRDWADLDLTGASDAAGILAAAHSQASDGDTIYLPRGVIATTVAWVISKSVSIEGAASTDVWPSHANGFDRPMQAPYTRGTVLLQSGAGVHGIDIQGAARQVNIRNLGIRFANRFVNTGHGINAVPPAYSTALDHGPVGFLWDNIRVYGHDGDHYAVNLTNALLGTLRHIRSYGGGALHLTNNGPAGSNYGNLVIEHLYGNLIAGGSAHGIHLEATSGTLNLITLIRPQVNAEPGEAATSPAAPQKLVEVSANVSRVTWIGADFEGTTSALDTSYGPSGFPRWVDPTGIHGGLVANKIFNAIQSAPGGNRGLWTDMTLGGYSSQPLSNRFNGAALGSAPPAMTDDGTSDDWRGTISFGSGTAPTTGIVADIRYNKNRGAGNPRVYLMPRNAATAALGLYVASETAVGFTVGCTTAPAASQAAGTYSFNYRTER